MKSQRILRTIPAALLMTTALSWNVTATAETTKPDDKASAPAAVFGGSNTPPVRDAAGTLSAPAKPGAGSGAANASGMPAPGANPSATPRMPPVPPATTGTPAEQTAPGTGTPPATPR
ncbi:MAG: hypothetical protein Q4G71_05535 [Pseudomonadota bacterium]|nr:hypothetical protein [Pseudomonadota bacterium]